MNQVNNYSIRIIKNENELTQAFALRYHVYKKTYPLCTAGLQQPFEIDEFDQLSIHIGLYKNEGKGTGKNSVVDSFHPKLTDKTGKQA